MNALYLKPGKEKIIQQNHPWIYSGAISRLEGNPENGNTVEIKDSKGNFLALAAYSQFSQIRARIWTTQNVPIDKDFFSDRIKRALERRSILFSKKSDNSYRLIHAESDLLPGLIVDQYDRYLVVQILSSGMEFHRQTIYEALRSITGLTNIYERSDADVRKLEGLPVRNEVISGNIPDEVIIKENDFQFLVSLHEGQKTGFYLDQRDNRALVGHYASGLEVLNCFSFTGAFSVYALGNGATHVTSIDSSTAALEYAEKNIDLNGFDLHKHETIPGDVFQVLRKLRDMGKKYDMVILDPPKFAPTSAQAQRAARGYKDINLLGFKLLRPGGILATFSCSGGINESLFQKIVADAALDAGVHATILHWMRQGADHPVGLNFPEGAYLKGLLCKVT